MCAEFNALTRSFGACFCLLGIGVTVQSLTLSEVWAESLFATNMVINLTKPLLGRSQRPGAPPPPPRAANPPIFLPEKDPPPFF